MKKGKRESDGDDSAPADSEGPESAAKGNEDAADSADSVAASDSTPDNPSIAVAISGHRGREAARDKRPSGGLAPSLVSLLWEHQLPAALAAGVAGAVKASEEEATAALAARGEGDRKVQEAVRAATGIQGAGEGPASAAGALLFAAVRQVMVSDSGRRCGPRRAPPTSTQHEEVRFSAVGSRYGGCTSENAPARGKP